jgi:hypothetical protein
MKVNEDKTWSKGQWKSMKIKPEANNECKIIMQDADIAENCDYRKSWRRSRCSTVWCHLKFPCNIQDT